MSETTHNQRKPPVQRRGGGKRKPLSCLACRNHKLRCDRRVPCGTCVRHHREDQCRQNPAPAPPPAPRRSNKMARPSSGIPSSPSRKSSPLARTAADDVTHHHEQETQGSNLSSGAGGSSSSHITGVDSFQRYNRTEHMQLPVSSSVSDGLSLLATFDMQQPSPWPSLPQLLAEATRQDPSSSSWSAMIDPQSRRKLAQQQLSSVIPSRPQCDLLLNFFLEHVNWLFQTVHEPSFRREYARFWDDNDDDDACIRPWTGVDLVWLSLLLTMLSVGAMYVPLEAVDVIGIPRRAIRNLAHVWHMASLHALRGGEYESRPCLVQLQTFAITQLYWYATNQIEVLNSRLGQAVKTAQAMRLDRDGAPSKSLNDEMRHRAWWDLVDSDMFQAICLDRPPLIRLSSPGVPLPLNCNDADLTDKCVRPRPIEEPTVMSMNIFRARAFQLLNRNFFHREAELDNTREDGTDGYDSDHRRDRSRDSAYENVVALDKQMLDLMADLPWYFQLDADGSPPRLAEPLGERITWQHHILRTCISTQRIRMHRRFLRRPPRTGTGTSWQSCVSAAADSMLVYRALRTARDTPTWRQKFAPQAYQVFSVAVTVAALLLVEGSLPISDVRRRLGDMVADLEVLEREGYLVPIAAHGRRVLGKMLGLCEARRAGAGGTPVSPEEARGLVPDIAIILGGERNTRAYVDRLQNSPPVGRTAAGATGRRQPDRGTSTATEEEMDVQPENGQGTVTARTRDPGAKREGVAEWDEAHDAGFGPGLVTPESSHLTGGTFAAGPAPVPGNVVDPELFFAHDAGVPTEILSWDMTGLLMLDSSDQYPQLGNWW
ncbi:hypothetical protein N3K66_007906 [Trichothecium roseum]|uniref:Uncharacterized protein n=1 Tax=Trichothecium roseum TaxID=47278 RepID=A0ACC0URY6_9HYPO|nr:hypothetical protein N3K66_007906 [Trichothecium roseum]